MRFNITIKAITSHTKLWGRSDQRNNTRKTMQN